VGRLNKEEKEILASFERGEWRSIDNLESESERYRKIARATFRKDACVNIRISKKDLNALKTRALEEGIPYQTLMSS